MGERELVSPGALGQPVTRRSIAAVMVVIVSAVACSGSGDGTPVADDLERSSTVDAEPPPTSGQVDPTVTAADGPSPTPTAEVEPVGSVGDAVVLDDPTLNCGNGLAAELMLLDATTGSVVWRRPSSHTMQSEIAVVDVGGRPAVVAGTTGTDGEGTGGFAADLASGALVWQDHDGPHGAVTNIVRDVMLELVYEGNTTSVRARSATDGRELWRHDGYLLPYPDYRQPDAMSADLIVISGWPVTDAVVAIEAATGDIRWTTVMNGEPQLWFHADGIFTLSGDGIYTDAGSGTATRLDPATGEKVWERDLDIDGTVTDTLIDDEALVIVTRRPDGTIGGYQAVLASTGEPLSAGPLPPETSVTALAGTGLVSTGQSYDVYGETSLARMTDLRTGTVVWERPAPSTSAIATTRWGVVFVRLGDGNSMTVELLDDTGAPVWAWTSPPRLEVASLAPTATSLLVSLTSSDAGPAPRGGVVALDPTTGGALWQHLTDLPVEQPALSTPSGIVVEQREPLVFCD